MPDPTAVNMNATIGKPGPALSATSDMPVAAPPSPPAKEDPDQAVEQPGEENQAVDAPVVEDESNDAAIEGDGKVDEKPAKEPGEEPPAKDAKKDETPAWMKAELTRERNRRRAAEQRADIAEGNLDRALRLADQAGGKEAKVGDKIEELEAKDPRPQRKDFDDPDKYEDALVGWTTRKATRIATMEVERKANEEAGNKKKEETRLAAEKEAKEITESYNKVRDAAREKYDDFDEVTTSEDLQISTVMADGIMRSENGAEVAYYLGKNPEESARIAKLPTAQQQLTAIGRIEERLLAKQPTATKAKPIVTPVGSRGNAVKKGPEDESMDEYADRRNNELRAGARH